MAESTVGAIQYVINTTLGELGALSTLKKQLQDIQKIAAEGAAFNIVIKPEALNGLEQSVARAANRGYRKSAFDGTTETLSGSGGSGSSSTVVVSELRQVVAALNKLAGDGARRRTAPPPTSARSYAEQSEEQRATGYDRKNSLLYALGRGKTYREQLAKAEGDQNALIAEQVRALQAARVRGKDTFAKERRELLKQYDTAMAMGDRGGAAKARDEMRQILEKIDGAIKERLERAQRAINVATQHVEMSTRNRNAQMEARSNGSSAPGQGLVLDATKITATMEHAAEAFAARLAAYVPEVPQFGREHGPATGGAAAVFAAHGYGATNRYGVREVSRHELPNVGCRYCDSTGEFKNGSTCWGCGGSKDENHPNREAALAAGANPNKIGSAAYRSQYQPIIPSSNARQAENLRYYTRLSTELNKGVNWDYQRDANGKRVYGPDGFPIRVATERTRQLTADERISHEEKMSQASYELLLGGLPASYAGTHPDLHNGMLLGKYEREKMKNDPSYVPIPAAGPVDPRSEAGDLSLSSMATHANELAGALDRLRGINLDPTVAQFRELATAINEARRDMVGFFGAGSGTANENQLKLAANKALNAERERHAQRMQDLKREVAEESRQRLVQRRADDLIRATAFESGLGLGGTGGADYDSQQMTKRLVNRFRRLDRSVVRQGELQDIGSAYAALQLPTHENVTARNQNLAQFYGLRTGLLRDLQTAALNEPRRYKGLLDTNLGANPNANYTLASLIADTEMHQRRTAAVGLLQAMQQEHNELITKSVKDPKYAALANQLAGRITTHMSSMESELGLPTGVGSTLAAKARWDAASDLVQRAKARTTMATKAIEDAKTQRAQRLSQTSDKDETARIRAESDAEIARLEAELTRRQAVEARVQKLQKARGAEFQAMFKDGVPKTTDMNKLTQGLAEHNTEIEGATKRVLELGRARAMEAKAADEQGMHWDRLARKLKDIAAYVVAGGLIYSTINAARTAIQETARFEQDMAEVQGIFVAKTQAERDLVKAGVMQSSVQYGMDRSTVAGIAKTFAQTGANPEKTIQLTNAALMGARGAGLNPDQATEMLIAVDNMTNGRVGSGDILDRISRVEARYPVTAQDLSTVLQRVGPMAQHLQPNMRGSTDAIDMLMGMSTSLISKTRMTGSQAGTALRFMLARLSSPNVQRKLQDEFGVMLGGSNPDEMRNMSDILGDIAGKYKGYMASGQSAKAAALLTTFAGARQANSAAALFDDWKSTMDVAKESSMAFGDSQRRLAIEMDTLEAKTQQAGSALLNFATVLLEKSGVLSLLKFGASTATSAAQLGANHPIGSMFGTVGALFATGSILKLLGSSEAVAQLGVGSQFLPLLGGLAEGLGIGAAGFGAYAGVRKLTGGRALYQMVPGTAWYAPSDSEEQKAQLYGPATWDRSTYDQSDQGKAFATVAGRYGMTSQGFYAAVTDAAMAANKDAESKFGKDALTAPNQKLGSFIQNQFIQHLSETLPAFGNIKDKAEQAAQGLEMLRQASQFGGVSYYVQQGDFTEKAQQLGQAIVQTLQSGGMQADVAAGLRRGDQLHFVPGIGFSHPRSFTQYKRGSMLGGDTEHVTNAVVTEMGLAYSRALAEKAGHTTVKQRNDDVLSVLNNLQPDFALGRALSTSVSTGGRTFLQTVDYLVESGNTLGKSLDMLASQMSATTDEEIKNLRTEKEKGALNAAQLEDLRKKENFESLVKSIRAELGITTDTEGRMAAAKAGAPSADTIATGGGGQFAETLRAAFEQATKQEVASLGPNTERAKQVQAFFDAHFDPKHWEATKENIVGAFNGVNLRAYLRDRVLEQLFQFGAREGTITESEKYLGGTGMIYDAGQERLKSAQQLLTGLLSTSGQLPFDRIKAAMRVNMAAGQKESLLGMDVNGLDGTTEEGRKAMAPTLEKAYQQLLKTGTVNDRQVEQLGVNLKAIQSANKEWMTGKPGDLFNYLDATDQKTMATIMGLTDTNQLGTYGAVSHDAVLRLVQNMVAARAMDERGTSLAEIARGGRDTRGLLSSRYGYAGRTQTLQNRLATQQLYGDQFGAFGTQHAMIGAEQGATIGMAQQEYQQTLAEIWYKAKNDTTGGIAADGTLMDKYATDAANAAEKFKTAVVEANLLAQQNLVQLLNDTHLQYLQKLEQHSQDLVRGLTEPITKLLADPRELLSSRKGGALVTEIGAFGNQRMAQAFMDNLVGPQGLFGKKLETALGKSPMFQEAELIRQAHIDGIVQGFRAAGFGSAGAGDLGAVSALSSAQIPAAGSAVPAALAMTGLVASGAFDGLPLGGALNDVLSAGASGASGTGTASLQAALAAAGTQAASAQKKAAIAQMATMASVYIAGNFFGNNGVRGANGKPNNYAVEGAQFGSTVGSIAGAFLPGGPMVWGPVGGFLGGLFGSREKKPEEKVTPEYAALQKIERNTRESVDAITNQTRTLLAPENRLLYAPSTFTVPQTRPFASGTSGAINGSMKVEININGTTRSGQDLATEIAAHLREQLANLGTYTDIRY